MTPIVSYLVPAELWREQPRVAGALDIIQDLAQEVMAIRRRLGKKVNEDAEADRYQETCELLEEAVQRVARNAPEGSQPFTSFVNDDAYFALLSRCWLQRLAAREDPAVATIDPWLGASVIPPENVAEHLAAMNQEVDDALWRQVRIDFLREATALRAGIVECQLPQADDVSVNLQLEGHLRRRVANQAELGQVRQGRVDVDNLFRGRIEQALPTGESVNMNNQNHVVITKGLAEFILFSREHPPGHIRVVYGDGSQAPTFPLRCLHPADPQREELVVPFSLMSMRHLLLDPCVVRNWLRNREIDQDSTLARSDRYCYQHAVAEFRSLHSTVADDQRLCVHLYHTGYEPAVVGVYRAAVESIRDEGDWLRIIPHFFVDPGFVTGPSWPPLAQ